MTIRRDRRLPSISDRSEAGDALMAALQDMVSAISDRAAKAEAEGRIPDATVEELKAAGAFRAVVPERFGGLELPFPYVPQIFRILARGDASTAWSMWERMTETICDEVRAGGAPNREARTEARWAVSHVAAKCNEVVDELARRDAEIAILEYINGFYNPRRRHSALGWKSPLAFERKVA